jgi:hypothetical protein
VDRCRGGISVADLWGMDSPLADIRKPWQGPQCPYRLPGGGISVDALVISEICATLFSL